MFLGYNTNGLAHHDPVEAIELLAEIGYQGVGITLDQHCLNPFHGDLAAETRRIGLALQRHGFRHVLETGTRFLLDRHTKHEPTLMTSDPAARRRRIEFYARAIELAAELGSDCVSIWSGQLRDPLDATAAYERLVQGLEEVLDYADKYNVMIGFEPEPGMFIDSMTQYERLLDLVDAPHFQLTLDVGHLHCLGETPLADYIRRYGERLVNVHIEDMRRGVHEHLPFGEGEIDFQPIFPALQAANYSGGVYVELSRHSHDGPRQAQAAFNFLSPRFLP